MLSLCQTRQQKLIAAFRHSYFNYNIKFVNSKDIPSNCTDKERNILWICDQDAHIKALKERYKNRSFPPVIAWSHPDNRQESLMGAPWLILSAEGLTPALIEEALARSEELPLTIARTERCLIRELTLLDLPGLLTLSKENTDNPDGCFFPEDCPAPDRFLADYIRNQYGFFGFGLFAVLIKDSMQFAGIAGFSAASMPDMDAEVSYALLKAYHHKGYAREALMALVPEAADRWQLNRVCALIRSDNPASLRLARACHIPVFRKRSCTGTDYE